MSKLASSLASFIAVTLVSALLIASCSQQEKHEDSGWPELEAFHGVMADAYHPVADSNTLLPAKRLAAKLDSSAQVLFTSRPDEQNQEILGLLQALRDSSAAFSQKVNAGAADSVLRPSITRVHDIFHHLMESGGGEMKHHK